MEVTEEARRPTSMPANANLHATGPFGKRREKLRIGTTNRVMTAFLGPKLQAFLTERRRTTDVQTVDVDLCCRSRPLTTFWKPSDRNRSIWRSVESRRMGPPQTSIRSGSAGNLATVLIAGKKGCRGFNKARAVTGVAVPWDELGGPMSASSAPISRSAVHLPKPEHGIRGSLSTTTPRSSLSSTAERPSDWCSTWEFPKDQLLQFEVDTKIRPRTLAVWKRKNEALPARSIVSRCRYSRGWMNDQTPVSQQHT